MDKWIVNIDTLTDQELMTYGFILRDPGEEFSVYWHPRYNEMHLVSNEPPRSIIVDDWNDAVSMNRAGVIRPIS